MAEERYDEDEVGLILRRAAELQPGSSMSLAELEAVADEAGIERALVRRAAAEIRRAEPPSPAPVHAGPFGPTRLVFERTVPGTVDPSSCREIVAEIRRHVAGSGQTEQVGDELIWSSRSNAHPRNIRVIVTPRRGKTLVRVEENAGGLAGGLYGGIMGGAGGAGLGWVVPVCIAVLHMPVLIPVLFAAWVYATYLLARTIHRSVLGDRARQLEALADGVAELTTELAKTPEPGG